MKWSSDDAGLVPALFSVSHGVVQFVVYENIKTRIALWKSEHNKRRELVQLVAWYCADGGRVTRRFS